LNNTLLKSYLRCKRKAWLDFKGNKLHKKWSAQKSIQLITQYKSFEKYTKGNLYQGYKGCEEGYTGVLGIKIKNHLSKDLNIEVQPSILIRKSGISIWGKYKYIPAVSKLGKKTTKTHIYDLALCAILLESFQDSRVDYGLVISNHKNLLKTEKIHLNKKLKDKAVHICSQLSESLERGIPDITDDRKKCSICSWQKFCDYEAKANGNITDIDGIGAKTAKSLSLAGINNVQQLAKYNKNHLNKNLSFFQSTNIELVTKYIDQARSYISGKPIRINKNENIFKLYEPENSGVFIFDIESNPDEKHDFLYGFISIKDINKTVLDNLYKPILNLKNGLNLDYIKEIFLTIDTHDEWPILHYGETEKITIVKLAKRISLEDYKIKKLERRFIDLHLILRKNWILPLKNYSLKTVASWIGFHWKQQNASGSRALFWWLQYKETHNNYFLEKIIKYNRDDCLATLEIARWLLEKTKNEKL
tara:strand:- start:1478 stop:2902 length:1425 start_codon:yes stop_codon:yes gene_type:complete